MSTESNLDNRSATAAADLSAKQFYAVTEGSTGIDVSTAAKSIDGILQDKPTSGQVGCYARRGRSKAAISASQTITKGGLLEVASGGTLVPIASGIAVAKAMESLTSVAAVRLISVELLPAAGVYA